MPTSVMDSTEAQWANAYSEATLRWSRSARHDARAVLNGIPWVLRIAAAWHDLPDRYLPYHTCHGRFQQRQPDDTLSRLSHALAEDLRARCYIEDIQPLRSFAKGQLGSNNG
jgi:transposase